MFNLDTEAVLMRPVLLTEAVPERGSLRKCIEELALLPLERHPDCILFIGTGPIPIVVMPDQFPDLMALREDEPHFF